MIYKKYKQALILFFAKINPYLTSLVLGGLFGLSFQASVFWPLLGFVFLGGFLRDLTQENNQKQIYKKLYLFFLCSKFLSLYWIGFAFSGMTYLIVGLFSSFLLSAFLALFYLFPGLSFKNTPQTYRIYAYTLGIWMCDYITSVVLTGFPWNLTGHLWGMLSLGWYQVNPLYDWPLSVMQIASVIGVHGLSFLTLMLIAMSVHAFQSQGVMRQKMVSFTVMILVGVSAFGALILKNNPTTFDRAVPKIKLVQPCVDPQKKWDPNHLNVVINDLLELSFKDLKDNVGMIVWPEAAIPLRINKQKELKHYFASFLNPQNHLVTGTVLSEKGQDYSAMIVLDHQANIVQAHRKAHIVPFGEYIPLKKWVPLHKLTPGSQDYTAGAHVLELSVKQYPDFLPLICYEAIFSKFLRDQSVDAQEKSQWILNITNDAWYGDSVGLWQHLANVRFRSIEEGLPLVRCANNGISGVIDAVGRIIFKTSINAKGAFDVALPLPIKTPWFSKNTYLIHGWFVLCFLGILFTEFRLRRNAMLTNN